MPPSVDTHDPDVITGILGEVSTQTLRLVHAAATLPAAELAAPSLLPGWTRGHVLAHVARQADAAAGVLREAAEGRSGTMYTSVEARNQAIEDGAAAGPAEQLQGLLDSAVRLLDAWRDLPVDRRDVGFALPSGVTRTAAEVPWLRWREVVLHHVDLGLTSGDLGGPLVGRLLDETVDGFTGKPGMAQLVLVDAQRDRRWELGTPSTVPGHGPVTVEGSTVDLVLWLSGRSPGTGLRTDAALPALPSWP